MSQGHDVIFLSKSKEWHAPATSGHRVIPYAPHRSCSSERTHPYLRRLESAVLDGQAAFRVARGLRDEGWIPDVIVSHVGFGSGLYLSDCFPTAKRIGCVEWFYRPYGSDVDFLRKGAVDDDRKLRLRTWNAQTLLEAEACDVLVTPTRWQFQQFPPEIQSKTQVIHEGIDYDLLSTLRGSSFNDPHPVLAQLARRRVVTYVSRGFEEYRGFPQAMKTFELIQKRFPDVHVAIAGSDLVAYGSDRSDGRTWQSWALDELDLDPSRTHWLGPLQEHQYHQLLSISSAHLYLTVPFVLSWSLLEAMAAGCSIVSSLTPPVLEVLENGQTALLVDFWDSEAQCQALAQFLASPTKAASIGEAASSAASRFAFDDSLRAWLALL